MNGERDHEITSFEERQQLWRGEEREGEEERNKGGDKKSKRSRSGSGGRNEKGRKAEQINGTEERKKVWGNMKNKEGNTNGGNNHFDGDDVTDGDDVIVYEPDGFVVDTKKARLQMALKGTNNERRKADTKDTMKENGIQNGGKIKNEGTGETENKDKRKGDCQRDKGKENQSGEKDKGDTKDETNNPRDQTAPREKEGKERRGEAKASEGQQRKGHALRSPPKHQRTSSSSASPPPSSASSSSSSTTSPPSFSSSASPSSSSSSSTVLQKVNIYETLEMARNPAFRHYTAGGGVNVVVDLERGVQDGTWKPPLPDSDGGDAEGGVGGSVVDFVTSKAVCEGWSPARRL
ncbi:uncharacterized protein DDB_G0284459-like [Penaeus monodon]|uniref:uncharacterized protein DDB_G0284459-like n=1 Tax=Penaeus monodon TaxID=6687 RepID=UPI0018A793E5|nr:uncharacterized protein DDB_G0284459-like [Penaeus monodon]XP_037788890.1 uncharacterized protein DDB_G0284459-like [Penaeus monodon]XP_037788891.1 uncharacterized protein DDB_G0284459-like [Penaeus monodon]